MKHTKPTRPIQLRSISHLLPAALLMISGSFAIVSAQMSDRPDGTRFVPDVIGQIEALSERGDALGLNIGNTPDPSTCKHYQGMIRLPGSDGTQFFMMTRSGAIPSFEFSGTICNDSPGETDNGNLIIFRMGSRDTSGERLRSNRLRTGTHIDSTPPPPEDVATAFYTIVDGGLVPGNGPGPGNPPNRYGHPGGMQLIGDVLALSVEHRESANSPQTLAMFLNVADPEHPTFLSQFPLVDINGDQIGTAGTMAVTPLEDDHYLMAVTGGANNNVLRFYRSTLTDLKDPGLNWVLVDEWFANTNRFIAQIPAPLQNICEISNAVVGPGGYCLSPDEQYAGQNWPDGHGG
ncbi:MAG: hypothetical protein ABIV21_02475, partial [Pyrinomonadaceae bacterium]